MAGNENAQASKPDPFKGKVLDKYLLIERLGSGGMGTVYRGEQTIIKRQVAVKLLAFRLINDEINVKRITREATAMANLNHPHIATIFDFGFSSEGQPYMVMELINGKSLKMLLKECKYLPPERAMRIAIQAADAMEYAHSRGLVHRDLKPDNLMLDFDQPGDFVKVLDFGIAKKADETMGLTKAGDVIGSPLYMSPEQCTGQKLNLRSDIYSLGVILYEMLTGVVPCHGATLFETIDKKTKEGAPPFPPHLAHLKALEGLTLACLSINPDDRPPSMQLLKQGLEALLVNFPVQAMGGMAPYSGAPGSGYPQHGGPTGQNAQQYGGIQTGTGPQYGMQGTGQYAPQHNGMQTVSGPQYGVQSTGQYMPGYANMQTTGDMQAGGGSQTGESAPMHGGMQTTTNMQAGGTGGAPARQSSNLVVILVCVISIVVLFAGGALALFMLTLGNEKDTRTQDREATLKKQADELRLEKERLQADKDELQKAKQVEEQKEAQVEWQRKQDDLKKANEAELQRTRLAAEGKRKVKNKKVQPYDQSRTSYRARQRYSSGSSSNSSYSTSSPPISSFSRSSPTAPTQPARYEPVQTSPHAPPSPPAPPTPTAAASFSQNLPPAGSSPSHTGSSPSQAGSRPTFRNGKLFNKLKNVGNKLLDKVNDYVP